MKVIIVTKATDLYYSEMIEIHDVIQITSEYVFGNMLFQFISAETCFRVALGDTENKASQSFGDNPRILRIYQYDIDTITITYNN